MAVEHTDVGAYALGLLEEPDRRAFEAHLAGCSACAAELADFRGMRDLFAGLSLSDLDTGPAAAPAAPPPAPPGRVIDMMRHKKAADRRRRQSSALLSAAAVISLLAGGVAVGTVVLDDGKPATPSERVINSAEQLLKTGERRTATKSGGLTGTVAMDGKPWGTVIAMDLTKVRGPLECQLIAVSKSGQERVVSSWSVPPTGYGYTDSAQPRLVMQGGVSTDRSDIARFDIRVTGGANLLSIPV